MPSWKEDAMSIGVDVVRRFRQLRALVIGDVMLDSYLEGTAARLCSEGPVPVVRKTMEERAPGGAANSAANLRALGADVALLGLLGPDIPGTLLRQALRDHDVDDRWLVEDAAVSTLHKLRILAEGQYLVRLDEGDTSCCSDAGTARLLAHLDRVFPRCDLVLISDYAYGVASEPLIERLRFLRAARPCVLVVDSKDLRRFHSAGATIITPNHREARAAVDPACALDQPLAPDEAEALGACLLALVDAEYAAITMAADGVCVVRRNGGIWRVPAYPVAHAHDVGAGDSFAAALALALAAGADCETAARIAIDAAGIAVTRRRTAIVRYQELLQRVSLREHAGPSGRYPASRRQAVAELAARLEAERAGDGATPRTVVFTNGVFDILHAGHVEFLRRARALGDILVVGVHSDASARRLKGQNRPINDEQNRLALVAALDAVDYAVLFDQDTPATLIRALRPDIHVKGGDYAGQPLPEADVVAEVGGRIEIVPLVGDLSTSGVIERILTRAASDPGRAVQPRAVELGATR
jgi:D-beta-D-heptose 7-phosphate kinase/D-beta-D-heptose 1-phosphate adenosyltransferase